MIGNEELGMGTGIGSEMWRRVDVFCKKINIIDTSINNGKKILSLLQ